MAAERSARTLWPSAVRARSPASGLRWRIEIRPSRFASSGIGIPLNGYATSGVAVASEPVDQVKPRLRRTKLSWRANVVEPRLRIHTLSSTNTNPS
jgi:hypothetical protein